MDTNIHWYDKQSANSEGASLKDWNRGFLLDRRSQGLSERSVSFYGEKLKKFYAFCLMNDVTTIDQITSQFIRTFFLKLEEDGHNPGGCHAFFRTLRAFFNWYEVEIDEDTYRNPMKRIKAPRVKLDPLEPITIEVIEKLLEVCLEGVFGLRDRAIIFVLMDTGVRASELLHLNREDINPISGNIMVRHGKGGKSREVYIGRKTRTTLRKYMKFIPEDVEYLWLSREGDRLSYGGLRSIMRRLADRAGVPTPSVHAFRRYFALEMLRSGVDVFSLQLLMGHADIQVLRRYLKQTGRDTIEAHNKGRPVDKHNL